MYNIFILPVVSFGCEAWSVILKDGHSSWLFENILDLREEKTEG
jgi:hypothetical protein